MTGKYYEPKTYSLEHLISLSTQGFTITEMPQYFLLNICLDVDGNKQRVELEFNEDHLLINSTSYRIISAMDHYGWYAIDGHDTAFTKVGDDWFYFNDERCTKTYIRFGSQYHLLFTRN